jgi:hypothetical protein
VYVTTAWPPTPPLSLSQATETKHNNSLDSARRLPEPPASRVRLHHQPAGMREFRRPRGSLVLGLRRARHPVRPRLPDRDASPPGRSVSSARPQMAGPQPPPPHGAGLGLQGDISPGQDGRPLLRRRRQQDYRQQRRPKRYREGDSLVGGETSGCLPAALFPCRRPGRWEAVSDYLLYEHRTWYANPNPNPKNPSIRYSAKNSGCGSGRDPVHLSKQGITMPIPKSRRRRRSSRYLTLCIREPSRNPPFLGIIVFPLNSSD